MNIVLPASSSNEDQVICPTFIVYKSAAYAPYLAVVFPLHSRFLCVQIFQSFSQRQAVTFFLYFRIWPFDLISVAAGCQYRHSTITYTVRQSTTWPGSSSHQF